MGNIYVTGYCRETWGTPVRAYQDGEDACAFKLDEDGNLIWNTFLGSTKQDLSFGIAVDGSGNSYIIGYSYGSWGTPIHAYSGSNHDLFVAKLNTDGELQWHTFWGSYQDRGFGIDLDNDDNIYITGYSSASWGTPIRSHSGNQDAYAAKLDNDGTLIWNTFLGGADYDGGSGIALDNDGNVYIGGWGVGSWGTPVNGFTGTDQKDGFAVKLDNDGNLLWNTFFGSADPDEVFDNGSGIGVDGEGNVYLSGYSESTWGSPITPLEDTCDIFLVKLNTDGTRAWNTFSGMTGGDYPRGMHVDQNGNSYIAGEKNNPFIYKINSSGKPLYTKGISVEGLYGINLDDTGNLLITGYVSDNNQDILVIKQLDPPTSLADFNGDGDTDVSVYRPSNGRWYIEGMGNFKWGLAGDLPVPGDYDGDGTTDIAIYRPSNGKWYVVGSAPASWGATGDIPLQADYTGDGAVDKAVLRTSTKRWYIEGIGNMKWYLPGDIPVPCDYNGDGAADIAIYRPSNNNWYVVGDSPVGWGQSGDIPVPADYDGDGACEIAVFRPSNGVWYVMGVYNLGTDG